MDRIYFGLENQGIPGFVIRFVPGGKAKGTGTRGVKEHRKLDIGGSHHKDVIIGEYP